MTEKILITGATGNVGAEVVRALSDVTTTTNVYLAVRDMQTAHSRFGSAYEYVRFDFTDPSTFDSALGGVDRLFLVRPPQLADIAIFQPLIAAAKTHGVQHIVFLSLQGIERVSFVPHAKIEAAIREAGIPYTFLRAGFFMQNLDTTHREDIATQHDLFIPAGDSQTAFIDVRDIGAVAAHVLTTDGHFNTSYTLTGSEALTYHDVATIFSAVLPFSVTYSKPSLIRFAWRFRQRGTPLPQVLVMCFLYTITRFGQSAEIHNTVERLLGRPPISMQQYVTDYQSAWLGAQKI